MVELGRSMKGTPMAGSFQEMKDLTDEKKEERKISDVPSFLPVGRKDAVVQPHTTTSVPSPMGDFFLWGFFSVMRTFQNIQAAGICCAANR